ncbi:MAG: glycosyl hydrolase [Anaerolineaceae bacterium]
MPGSTDLSQVTLLVATRKGGFFLRGSRLDDPWILSDPIFMGAIINHIVLDPRDGRTMLMAALTGHLGPTIFRSTDYGQTWKEARRPPAFPKASEGEKGIVVRFNFWLSPGHASEPGVWYAGTCPPALFRSKDGGDTWQGVAGFNANPMWREWTMGDEGGTPGGPTLHSIQIDPRSPNHLYIGSSPGGVFETTDRGATWQPLNKGISSFFLPNPEADYGHCTHALRINPQNPDILYQQNHCGIYRMLRQQGRWVRIGKAMPEEVGDIGFPMVLHPRNPQTAWVFPMDATDVWSRTSPGGHPAVYRTDDGGQSWVRHDAGFPRQHGYFTVKRQAMNSDRQDPLGLYLGTTAGQVWGSRDEGRSWARLADNLPEVLAVEAAVLPK